jgi:predicted nucleic acid-binding protein
VTATLVDSNVLIDVFSRDPSWAEWSSEALVKLGSDGPLVINVVIYAEISHRYSSKEILDRALPEDKFMRENIPWAASFLAGKVFADYRERGGQRRSPLPDFFIGAHAAVGGLRLLTRDVSRYRTYFPRVDLVAPERRVGPS